MGQAGDPDRERSGGRKMRHGTARPAAPPIVRAIAPVMPAPARASGRLPCAAQPDEIGRTLLPLRAPGLPASAAFVPPAGAAARLEADPFVRRLARLD